MPSRNMTEKISFWSLFVVGVYLAFLFPFGYFRNDDWLHLGNSVVRLPEDWGLLWRPSSFFMATEHVHFFRPLVKLLVYLQYQAFGMHHYFWLLMHLVCFIASVFIVCRSIYLLTQSKLRTAFFGFSICAAFHLHLGSILWIGEGVINCPQVLLLSLCLYFFIQGSQKGQSRFALSVLFYILSLGMKESSVFFPGLLLGLSLFYKEKLLGVKHMLLTMFAIGAFYLIVRLGLMPFNQAYAPVFDAKYILFPIFVLLASFLFTPLLYVRDLKLVYSTIKKSGLAVLFMVGFVAVVSAPYVGHDFFSPGWLLYPGFFSLFIYSLLIPDSIQLRVVRNRSIVLLVFSLSVVLFQMHRVKWWQWKEVQLATEKTIRDVSPHGVQKILLYDCDAIGEEANLNRVVGGAFSVYHIWELTHGSAVPIDWPDCWAIGKQPVPAGTVQFRWQFPHFTLIPSM